MADAAQRCFCGLLVEQHADPRNFMPESVTPDRSALESLAADFRAWCIRNDYQDKVTDGELRVTYRDGQVEIALGCHALGDGRWVHLSFKSEAFAIAGVREWMARCAR